PEPRFLAIRQDIDDLKWQIDRLSQGYAPRTAPEPADRFGNSRLAESMARIERQLDGLNRGGKSQSAQAASHQTAVDRAFRVDDVFAEIAARQQLLEAESPETQPFGAPALGHEAPRAPVDPSAIEHQLRDIATRIKALQGASRCDSVAADIART